jgi:hypothetical protein
MPKITKAERIALHKVWERRISEFRMSGQTRGAWCEANQVPVRQFHYWFSKLTRQESVRRLQPGNWAQIQVKETPQAAPPYIQSALSVRIGPAIIEVRDGYNPSLLLDLVKVLQKLC